ncbi:MAG: GNAT family N-acetyltransferase [Jiangellaceae bacterium]
MSGLKLRPMSDDELVAYGRQRPDLGGPRPGDGQHLFAAEVGGEVVGRLWLSAPSPSGEPGQGQLHDVEVSPAHRGRGYGRELMHAAFEQARQRGCTSLGLDVAGDNDVAIRLHQSLGFRTASVRMWKPLSPPSSS